MTHEAPLPIAPSPPVRPVTRLDRLTWDELPIWADLIAAFYEREGRDPRGIEYAYIRIVVWLMTISGARWLH